MSMDKRDTGQKHGRKPIFEMKDDGGGGGAPAATTEPETFEAVTKEIWALDTNTKELFTGLQGEHAKLKQTLDGIDGRVDALTQKKIDTLSETILTKQEALET